MITVISTIAIIAGVLVGFGLIGWSRSRFRR